MASKSGLDVSQITDYLYISAWPRGDHADEIRLMNIGLVLSMHWIQPFLLLARPPAPLLWLPTIDTPWTPMPMFVFTQGVRAALPVIRKGCSVLVHCKSGRHRSVAMATCVLIGMGYSADEAMDWVVQKRPAADPHAWYLESRIYKFELIWRARKGAVA